MIFDPNDPNALLRVHAGAVHSQDALKFLLQEVLKQWFHRTQLVKLQRSRLDHT